ncbi:MAG: helix-turn-helix transcriptional regulator [Sulfuricella sp.]|nr:helix-turn-helix transcriptional regulator [Sulfuricella sp.]
MANIEKKKLSLSKRLGGNIAVRRKALRLTQEQLAHRLEVEPETISRMERGMTAPSLKTLEKLGEILAVRMADLLDEQSPAPPDGVLAIAAWIAVLSEKDEAFVMDCLRRMVAHLDHREGVPKHLSQT